MAMYAAALVDAGALGTIRLPVLMLAINHSKAIQMCEWIAPGRLPAFPSPCPRSITRTRAQRPYCGQPAAGYATQIGPAGLLRPGVVRVLRVGRDGSGAACCAQLGDDVSRVDGRW
jgi:hypothetical protein